MNATMERQARLDDSHTGAVLLDRHCVVLEGKLAIDGILLPAFERESRILRISEDHGRSDCRSAQRQRLEVPFTVNFGQRHSQPAISVPMSLTPVVSNLNETHQLLYSS